MKFGMSIGKWFTAVVIMVVLFIGSANSQNSILKDRPKSKVVDHTKLWYRITGAVAATRYPFLDETEKTWPVDYRTIVNGAHQNFAIEGPNGYTFIYPSIVILDADDNIKQIAVVENSSLVTEERAKIWKFLSTCFDSKNTKATFDVYVPVADEAKAAKLLKANDVDNYTLYGYQIVTGYLEIDGSFVHNVFDAGTDISTTVADVPIRQRVTSEVMRNRIIRINATTGYPYFDQADNSWSTTFKPYVINDEVKRFGLKGTDDMGMVYPSILILDEGDYIRLIGMIEPAENVTEERAKVWRFLSDRLDNKSLKFLYIHVPHGMEKKALNILERNKINYSGLRGYSVVDGKLLITLVTTLSKGDNR